ncbi:MAG: iron export ABC transporter permease subunit FetB [Candidatus Thiodiazotropha sp. L084R]
MNLIQLTPLDLFLASTLVLLLALISLRLSLGIEGKLLIAALRTIIQLSLIGLVLKFLFVQSHPALIASLAMFMLMVAGYEVMARQQRRFNGVWGIGVGTLSMFISSFSVTILALIIIIQAEPWYSVQYLIPLLGMLLGNTMSGVAIALDNLTQNAWQRRQEIEARLILGHTWDEAIRDIRRTALRSGLIPIINAMAAAGIVSLPGMMTGQILAGAPPMEASKYQILIMLLIAAGTGFGATVAVWIGSKRLFDERDRLRLERLSKKRD